jgi:hypothetical protein
METASPKVETASPKVRMRVLITALEELSVADEYVEQSCMVRRSQESVFRRGGFNGEQKRRSTGRSTPGGGRC